MIIVNGTLAVECGRHGGLDAATGYPVATAPHWREGIPCQILPNVIDRLGRSDGEPMVTRHFGILVEGTEFTGERVRLSGLDGCVIGEFSVVSVVPLEAVCQTEITV